MTKQDTIFGKSMEDIVSIIEEVVGTDINSLSVSSVDEINGHPGYQGQKLIPTFRFKVDDETRELKVFIKKHNEPDQIESDQFRHAHKHGAPIPNLYHSFRDDAECEVLFIEHLSYIQSDEEVYCSPGLFRRFVRLIARLNSIPVDEAYASLPHHGCVHPIPLAQLDAAQQLASSVPSGMHLPQTLTHLSNVVSSFPLGFVHGDFWPHHSGTKTPDGDMMAIDLGLSLHASRFFDVAPFVGPSFYLPSLSLSREEVAATYLEAYRENGADAPISEDNFLAEADAVWLAWNSRIISQAAAALGKKAGDVQRRLSAYLKYLSKWKEGEPCLAPYGQ